MLAPMTPHFFIRCLLRLQGKMSALLLSALVFASGAALAADAPSTDALRVGSKRFTESYILAEVVAQTAAPHSAAVPRVLQGLGNTAIVYAALRGGSIDIYPEYAGTIAQEILKSDKPLSLAEMNLALAPLGLVAAVPLGFNDGYALALREADALQLGIKTLSDLRKHPELKLGLSNEFIGRADGWKGLAQRYGLPQKPVALDHGLAYDAVAAGQIDVMDIYTTDAKIAHLGLRVLQDDLAYFPRYDAVLLMRQDVPQKFPAAWAAIGTLAGSIDEASMIAMNAQAELKGLAFDRIARDHLAAQRQAQAGTPATPLPDSNASRGFWAKLFGADLARLALQHVMLVLASVTLAALVAVPLAVLAFPHARARKALLGVTGMLQTIPSLALLALLISLLGSIGTLPALMALTLYALLPIMRNTVTGLNGVPSGLRDAGQALGLRPGQRLWFIELPLAMPSIVAGVRTASAIAIGTATIAAFIGAGGFGERIVTGLALNDRELLLAGALPAAALALLSEGLFEWIELRWFKPR